MYCRLVSESILDGLQVSFSDSGNDAGESDLLKEDLDLGNKVDEPKDSTFTENEDKSEVKQNSTLDISNKNIDESEINNENNKNIESDDKEKAKDLGPDLMK